MEEMEGGWRRREGPTGCAPAIAVLLLWFMHNTLPFSLIPLSLSISPQRLVAIYIYIYFKVNQMRFVWTSVRMYRISYEPITSKTHTSKWHPLNCLHIKPQVLILHSQQEHASGVSLGNYILSTQLSSCYHHQNDMILLCYSYHFVWTSSRSGIRWETYVAFNTFKINIPKASSCF